MNDAREMLELADRIAPIAGRCSIEADRYILIEAVGALRTAGTRAANQRKDLTMFGSKRRIAELEAANAKLQMDLVDERNRHHPDLLVARNQVEYLVRTIRDMDEQIYKMSQCNDWYGMQPHFRDLAEGMTVRKRAESDRIGELIRPELIKTYNNDQKRLK